MGVLIFATLLAVASPLPAAAQEVHAFNVAAPDAASAIRAFGAQAGLQILASADDLTGKKLHPVTGDISTEQALNTLLAGTGLDHQYVGERVVALVNNADSGGAASAPDGSRASTGAPTAQSAKMQFNIPTQALDLALRDFSAQSGLAIAAPKEVTAGKKSKGARGTMSATEALRRILKGTGLTFVMGTDGRYAIQANASEGPIQDKSDAADVLVEGQQQKEKPYSGMNVDIPRTIDDVQPYYIFDSKTIELSGASSVEDFLKQRLTMNTTAQTNLQNVTIGSIDTGSSINLRGLGTDKTLILVNGRKMVGNFGTAAGSFGAPAQSQFNLNGIPLSAIDRIEVLPSSASGIYGGSALGGVINVILKKNYTGGEVALNYNNTWDAKAPNRAIDLSYGAGFNDGKTHVTFNADWSDSKPLLLQDRRSLVDRGLGTILKNDPSFIYSSDNPFLGAQPNIAAVGSYVKVPAGTPGAINYGGIYYLYEQPNLVLKAGGSLNSPITHVPAGTSNSTPSTTLNAGLLANAGSWNLSLPRSAEGPTGLLQPLAYSPSLKSFGVSMSQELWSGVTANLDWGRSEYDTSLLREPLSSPGNTVIPAGNPFNPFTSDVQIQFPISTLEPSNTKSDTDSVTIGITATLPYSWTMESDYSWSRNSTKASYHAIDYTFGNDLSAGLINPFVDTIASLDLQKYDAFYAYDFHSTVNDLALRGSGPLPALPWGTPRLTVGLERLIAASPQSTVGSVSSLGYSSVFYARHQESDSKYAEALIPLVKEDWLPLMHSLELQLAGRIDRFTVDAGTPSETTFAGVVSYGDPTKNGLPFFSRASYTARNNTFGVAYRPVNEVIIRVSRATAFLPPLPSDLTQNPLQDPTPSTIIDPRTKATVSVNTISGGNPNIKPQHSKSWNAGIVWEPVWTPLQGLRLDAEYYKIDQFDAISSLGAQTIVNNESAYPGRVTRDASGTITFVNTTRVNLFKLETEGWDLTADYPLRSRWGVFNLHAAGSIINHLRTQYDLTLPEYDAVNFPSEAGAAKYKANLAIDWQLRKWSAVWSVRYFGSYKSSGALGGPSATQNINAGGTYTPSPSIVAQGSDTIPSQAYHDAVGSYTFDKSSRDPVLSGLTLQLGIQNVFNKIPPLDVNYPYYISPYGDIRLRSYWLRFKKPF